MTPEPLKWKLPGYEPTLYRIEVLKSAVEGLIKFHEDRIEELIIELKETRMLTIKHCRVISELIKEYESINAIEHWLEDII